VPDSPSYRGKIFQNSEMRSQNDHGASGFTAQAGAARTVRGWLLLAWLSLARDQAGEQPDILEKETGRQQNPRPHGESNLAQGRLAGATDLGM
jgi:hypothetical protein